MNPFKIINFFPLRKKQTEDLSKNHEYKDLDTGREFRRKILHEVKVTPRSFYRPKHGWKRIVYYLGIGKFSLHHENLLLLDRIKRTEEECQKTGAHALKLYGENIRLEEEVNTYRKYNENPKLFEKSLEKHQFEMDRLNKKVSKLEREKEALTHSLKKIQEDWEKCFNVTNFGDK